MPRSWSGAAQSGSREYTPQERSRITAALPRRREDGMKLEDFARSVFLEARTVRAALADGDGVDFLLAYDDGLMWAAENADDAEHHTRILKARARREYERAERREAYAERLPRRQGVLI